MKSLTFGFVVVPNFSLIALSACVDPLRIANQVLKEARYQTALLSIEGGLVTSSDGIAVMTEFALSESPGLDAVFVVGPNPIPRRGLGPLTAWLRKAASAGTPLAGVDTGAYLMAQAGLLDGYRCTIHWQDQEAMAQQQRGLARPWRGLSGSMTPPVQAGQLPPREPGRIPAKGKLSIAFILAPRFTLLAFSAFVDTLRLAADEGDRSRPIHCAWSVLSHNMRPVRSSCGVEVVPTIELDDPRSHDYVVVVGGLLDGPPVPAALLDYLRQAAGFGVPMVGVCTGSFVLAQLGLLQGRRCCVSWFHYAEFEDRFPQLQASSDELFIIDQDRLTCAGGTSVVHLASHLVARHCGPARAAKALRIMIEETPLPSKAPQPQPLLTERTDEARVRKAMLLLERNLGNPLSPAFVARHVGLGTRQLERLFKAELGLSPAGFALRLRLANARQLLQNTRAPVSDIALQCGFVNRSHFARSFRAAFGNTPSRLRESGG